MQLFPKLDSQKNNKQRNNDRIFETEQSKNFSRLVISESIKKRPKVITAH